MLTDRHVAPLSPPTSPRMSDTSAKATDYNWQHPPYVSTDAGASRGEIAHGLPTINQNQIQVGDQVRPGLRSYKSFPYSLGPSSRFSNPSGAPEQQTGVGYNERLMTQGPQPAGTSDLAPATYGGSAPTSPAGRLTPRSGGIAQGDEQGEDEDIDLGEGGEDEGDEKPPMTAAELRAHKRKMKRFRLTHNQTRFLMSEFARQAHPDAAHRERLSREIPGLSPRQVQVWFQNRRAKLKRLTTDDRERMLRSRALPESFDMTQALHSPFGTAAPPTMGTPMPSPGAYSHFGNDMGGGVRPLTLDTLRRVPDYEQFGQNQYTTSTGMTPAIGQFAFTPPQSATETVSPGSAASDMSSFGFQPRPPQESPRRPFGVPLGTGPPGYGSHPPQMPRLHMHERFSRPMGETASSPLRTSMSYSALGSGSMSQHTPTERSASFSEHTSNPSDRSNQQRSLTNPSPSSAGPYGLGFSYGQLPPYQHPEQAQQNPPQSTSAPQPVGFQSYRRDSHMTGTPASTYPPYQPSAFVSHMPQYSGYGSSYPQPPAFTSPYQPPQAQRHQQHHQQSQAQHQHHQAGYGALPGQSQQFVALGGSHDGHSQDEGDNSDNGGVPVPPSY